MAALEIVNKLLNWVYFTVLLVVSCVLVSLFENRQRISEVINRYIKKIVLFALD